mgnify:FL=1
MIDANYIKANLEQVKKNLAKKGFNLEQSKFEKLYSNRKGLITKHESLLSEKNIISKDIGLLKSNNKDASSLLLKVESINKEIDKISKSETKAEKDLHDYLLSIPNLLDDSVPEGKSDDSNKIIYESKLQKNSLSIDHLDIINNIKLSFNHDVTSISGSRFSLLFNDIAKLHRVLGQYMINYHVENNNYTEVYVPLIVNEKSLIGTGQLPKFKDDLFEIKNKENSFLIPTAEVPLTNICNNQIIELHTLPLKFVSLTPCFRSEAGSYGKDTKGLIRQHQFDKVELVQIAEPAKSNDALNNLVSDAEKILINLSLPYRKVLLCSGDTSFSSSITYDLEVWLPSQSNYREISSCSNFLSFQSRRLNIRYRNEKKKEYPHTLNGSGLAVGRTLAAIIENNINDRNEIAIPEPLQGMMGSDCIKIQG